jgi:uncharacterized protein YecE (DUF72 family)
MSKWRQARESRTEKVQALEKLIPGYDYSHEDLAHRTDENLCKLLVEHLREAKRVAFNILQTAFELHRDMLLKDFEKMRDELDIFSDEIKARAFDWDRDKPQEWLERLIDYDYRVVVGLGNLRRNLEGLEKEFLSAGQKVQDLKRLDEHVKRVDREIEGLVIMFKEREAVCNIKEASLEKTFDRIRSQIRKGV